MSLVRIKVPGKLNSGVSRPILKPPFDPIANFGSDLVAWYDPSLGINGQTVTSLTDKSSSSRHGSVITGTPVYDSDGLNGTPAIVFNGSSRISTPTQSDLITTGVPMTVLLNGLHSGSSTGYFVDGSSGNNLAIFRSSVSTTGFGARRGGMSSPLSGGVAGDANPHSFVFVASGADGVFYRDGNLIASGNTLTNSVGQAFNIGSNGSGSSMLTGFIGDVIIVKKKLTTDEILEASEWLMERRAAA